MAVEISEAKRWIYEALHDDTALAAVVGERIYADQAPPGVMFPYILYNLQVGQDINGCGTARIMVLALMQVRVVVKGQPNAQTYTADARLDDVLHTSSVRSGGYVFSARREGPIDRPEFDAANNRYHHVGGFYQLYISKAA